MKKILVLTVRFVTTLNKPANIFLLLSISGIFFLVRIYTLVFLSLQEKPHPLQIGNNVWCFKLILLNPKPPYSYWQILSLHFVILKAGDTNLWISPPVPLCRKN